MLKEQAELFATLSKLTDLFAVASAFVLAYFVRFGPFDFIEIRNYLWVLLFILPVWHFLLSHYRTYYSLRTSSISNILLDLLKVHIIGGVTIAAIIYTFEPQGFSRFLFGSFIVFSYLFLACCKVSAKTFLGSIRRKGYNYRNILIVGLNARSLHFARLIEDHSSWGLRIVGFVQPPDDEVRQEYAGYKVHGTLDGLLRICAQNTIDEVVFCLPSSYTTSIDDTINDLEETGITIRMVLDIYEIHSAKREFSFFHNDIPILTFYSKAFDGGQLFLKRNLDVFGAMVGLVITAALFPIIALAIKLESPGPVLFFSTTGRYQWQNVSMLEIPIDVPGRGGEKKGTSGPE